LFPEGFRNEVQVISTVMSVDQDCSSEIAAMIGSSIALSISDIPFNGPIAGINVGIVDGEFIINPSIEQQAQSDLELTVAGTKDEINMVEAGANEISEATVLDAIMFAHEEIARLVTFQEEIVEQAGKEKTAIELFEIDPAIKTEVETKANQEEEKHAREDAIEQVKEETLAQYEDAEEDVLKHVKLTLDDMLKDEVRRLITEEKVRPDGRKTDEIRPLSSRVGLLP